MRFRYKRSSQILIVFILVPVISLCATFLLLYTFAPSAVTPPEMTYSEAKNPPSSVPDTPTVSRPQQLTIRSIDVSAAIKPAGLTSAGDMDINDNPNELAWYKFGPKPGEAGSAVIAGHYGWKNGKPAVFNELNKLVKGDEMTVKDEVGRTMVFAVTRTAAYDPNQDATDVFKSNDGTARLNVITCQGTWSNSEQTYSKRLVIFTEFIR
jgi:LPXTG-site transpeptidase (sortase) family protein